MYDLNMNEIEFPEGFIPLDIFISSIDKDRITDKVEGGNRKLNYGSTYNERDIQLSILLKSHDTQDYRLLRNATYALFNKYDSFYLVEEYQRGKRYLVSADEKYIPERMTRRHATATINCFMSELPFAESIGTSADIDRGGINSDDALWGYGMGLITDEDSLIYSREVKSGESFYVYNAGNVDIHPFEQDLNIAIKNFDRTSEPFEIKNITNRSGIKVNGKLNESDVVEIKGPNVTINNLAALRRTDRRYIELSKGWNEFVMTGAYKATIEFDFRFYYK